jgi:hypothetical protein
MYLPGALIPCLQIIQLWVALPLCLERLYTFL